MPDLFPAQPAGSTGGAGAVAPPARHGRRSYWYVLLRAVKAAAVVHLAFSIVFFALHAPLMGWANLGSIALYGLAYMLLKRRLNRAATVLVWAEILLHALVSTRVLGWESGFHYYVLLMVPMVFVSPSRTLHVKIALGVALAVFYAGLDYLGHHHTPLSRISPAALAAVRYFNIATALSLLAYLAHYYLGAVLSAERRLQALATTDALTDLANRRRALDVAAQQLGRRRRDGTPLSFILGDVDHFKSINDRFGHEVGDRVLVDVAQALRRATREYDTVCRWGGEEFLVLLPETALSAALQVAERARDAVQQARVSHQGHALAVTITLGVSTLRDGESLEEAIARADAAMYRGKVGGRNRCVGEEAGQPVCHAETLARD